jgi:hypothetical protein
MVQCSVIRAILAVGANDELATLRKARSLATPTRRLSTEPAQVLVESQLCSFFQLAE